MTCRSGGDFQTPECGSEPTTAGVADGVPIGPVNIPATIAADPRFAGLRTQGAFGP